MAEVKSGAAIQEKYTRVTPGRSEDYKIGVTSPRRSWSKAATTANQSWKDGVAQASAGDRFAKGVNAAGDGKWQSKALDKGPGRFSEGTMKAGGDYLKGVQPYLDTIASTAIPPRFPKGDPRNINRVSVLNLALRKKKVGG
jgi:hypothetical protein